MASQSPASAAAASIAPGAAAPFSIRLENPPLNAVDLEASFAAPGEAMAAPAPISAPQAEPPMTLSPEDAIADEGEPHALLGDFGDSLMRVTEHPIVG